MASDRTIAILDRHYASELGCAPGDLSSGKLVVVESEMRNIRFAKGVQLAELGLQSWAQRKWMSVGDLASA